MLFRVLTAPRTTRKTSHTTQGVSMRPSAGHYQGRSRDSKGDHHGASGSGGGASYSRPALTPTTDFRYSSSSSAGAPGLIPHQQPVMPPAQPYSSYSSASDRWPQRAPLPPQQPDPYIPSYRPPWPDSDRSHSAGPLCLFSMANQARADS